jgi:hypothetical protein
VWIVDTGVTNHMTGSRAASVDLDTHVRGTVRFDDGSAAEIEGHKRVEFVCKNGELRSFDEVYFIPKLTANIVSVGRLDEDGYHVHIGSGELTIREPEGKLLARVKRTMSQLYLLLVKLSVKRCLLMKEEAEAWHWHERLSHINFQAIKMMAKEELVRGLPVLKPMDCPCKACLAGKQRQSSFLAQVQFRAEKVLELVHGDLCGKISPPAPAGNQYFILLVDDRSKFTLVELLATKDQAFDAI